MLRRIVLSVAGVFGARGRAVNLGSAGEESDMIRLRMTCRGSGLSLRRRRSMASRRDGAGGQHCGGPEAVLKTDGQTEFLMLEIISALTTVGELS